MDPDAALEDIRTALAAGDTEAAAQSARDLSGWVLRGGFPPADPAWRDTLRDAGRADADLELEAGQ
jgi:hypothetical protein